MDAISLAIVVTVLSLGSALVYLFKSDYEARQSTNHPKPPQPPPKETSKRSSLQQYQQHNSRSQQTNVRPQSSKSLAPTGGASKQQQVPADYNTVHSNGGTGLSETKQIIGRSILEKPKSNGTTGHKQQQVLLNNNLPSANGIASNNQQQQHNSKKKEFESANLHRLSLTEPLVDEDVDTTLSSDMLNAFSLSINTNKSHNIRHNDKIHSPKTSAERRNSGMAKKKHSIDYLANGLASKDTYSSEKLFNLMAASNLSKEEIELAIETLLNKLESGSHDNDWKPAKSDPLHKLRNQLRENEAALIAAIQNHELSQSQCNKLKQELKEERLKVNQVREELDRCKKELGVVKVALEQVRSKTGKLQLLDDERLKTIASLEKTQEDLKEALTDAKQQEVELRKELEDKRQQLQKIEVSDQNLIEKVQDLEMKLKSSELQIQQIHCNKNETDYETSEKISELESEQVRLNKALKDQSARLNDSLELNNHLQESVKDLKDSNERLGELLKRQKDEKIVSESMLRGNIAELEQELKDLDVNLNAHKSGLDEKDEEIHRIHNELIDVKDERIKIENELNEFQTEFLRILSNIPGGGGVEVRTGNWIRKCLDSADYLKDNLINLGEENQKLAKMVEQLTEEKLALMSDVKTLSSRSNSPTNSSKASTRNTEKSEERKLVDKKNLELENIQQELAKKDHSADLSWELSRCQMQIKDLKLEKSKLEAQIKFGLDSLKMEQERAKKLEEELEEHGIELKQNE